MVQWLRVYSQSQSTLLDFWRQTSKTCLAFINSKSNPSLHTICKSWPRYEDPEGYLLVTNNFAQVTLHLQIFAL